MMEKGLGPEGVGGERGECILKIVIAKGGGGGEGYNFHI